MNPLNNYASKEHGELSVENSDNEMMDKMFKVVLSEPKPDGLQISKKNICIITIL